MSSDSHVIVGMSSDSHVIVAMSFESHVIVGELVIQALDFGRRRALLRELKLDDPAPELAQWNGTRLTIVHDDLNDPVVRPDDATGDHRVVGAGSLDEPSRRPPPVLLLGERPVGAR